LYRLVHAPIGTVIHLVSGETPSFIEEKSTSSFNPWDIPINTDEKLQTAPETVSNEIQILLSNSAVHLKRKQSWDWGRKWKRRYSVAELTIPGQQLVIAKGGEGSLGNTSLPKKLQIS
jgi:GTPase involved in cell partitioning and DNA repair